MAQQWDDETDVLVVGFGGAGACAAIEAADNGSEVLALDRFDGGGATAISGGVVYAGGGTAQQKDAGFADTTEAMLEYLRLETNGAVSDETLRDFCENSIDNLEWLQSHGVPFDSSFCPYKTSYPTNEHYLYYSGNEITPPYSEVAEPAPRGHRVHGRGTSGKGLTDNLDAAARAKGVRVWRQSTVTELITDANGNVVGAQCRRLPGGFKRAAHRLLSNWNRKLNIYYRPLGKRLDGPIRWIERSGVLTRVRARRGVVLAAGGFVFNKPMLTEHAPAYRSGSALGTIGDDGSGIGLGRAVGGATTRMHRVSAWRFINPPVALSKGVLVDRAGDRFVNELSYGAKVGERMVEEHGGIAYLIADQRLVDEAKRQLPEQTLWFQRLQMEYLFRTGHIKADSIEELARRTGIDERGLVRTLSAYNAGGPDAFGKAGKYLQAIERGPYYAFDCSLRTRQGYPCPMITLGGLAVDEASGLVRRADGSTIAGLYAAGRNASGICSESYVSGLSIADCVYSGRRAGRHVATREGSA